MTAARRQHGFSLIELMVALTIGLLLSGVVVSVFITTNRQYAQDEQIGRMQEEARYALRILSADLRMVDFWGNMLNKGGINAQLRDCSQGDQLALEKCIGFYASSELAINADCPSSTIPPDYVWAYDIYPAIDVLKQVSGTDANSAFTCIAADEISENTDVLAIKRLKGEPLPSAPSPLDDRAADDGKVFLRTNGETGMLIEYDHTATAGTGADVTDWPFVARIYYIRRHFSASEADNIPTLYRRQLNGTAMELDAGGVARGIEYFHVMFGIDTDTDGTANAYVSEPSDAEMAQAVTARVYVLARSLDPDYSYTNDKTYQLGDVTRSGNGDNFYRRVFVTTVKLRNPINRALLGV